MLLLEKPMNAIDYCINEIKLRIPKAILHYTFSTLNLKDYYNAFSEDYLIRQRVIENKVLIDCDLLGGEEVVIPFENIPFKKLRNGNLIYQIPKKSLQGRTIISALSICTGDVRLDTCTNSYYPSSAFFDAMGRLLDAAIGPISQTSNRVKLIGENVILLEDNITFNQLYLRCVLSNDRGLSNFSPRAYPSLAQLAVLACKSIIYNESVLEIDAGQLLGGVSIGRFKEIVDSYADSDVQYQEYLKTTFTKVLMMQDKTAHSRHLRMLTNGLG